MKAKLNRYITAIALLSVIIYSCSKSTSLTDSGNLQSALNMSSDGKHVYGLLAMSPDQYANLPLYSKESFPGTLMEKALSVPKVVTL